MFLQLGKLPNKGSCNEYAQLHDGSKGAVQETHDYEHLLKKNNGFRYKSFEIYLKEVDLNLWRIFLR